MIKPPALIALTLILAACGASQTTAPTTAPGSSNAQVIAGTVTALSADHQALTVAGQPLHLGLAPQSLTASPNGATVRVNGDDANALALSIGQHVTVRARDDTAREIEIEKQLRGTVSSLDLKAGNLVVNGQTVTVTPTTRIELSRKESSVPHLTHTLADLQVGAFIEVTGEQDASGAVLASSIEVRGASERHEQGQDDQAELHGAIRALDATARTFSTAGATVDYHLATVRGAPVNGLRAEVKGTYDASTGVLLASRLRVEDAGGHDDAGPAPVAGAAIQLEARVTSLDLAARTLVAGPYTVDFARAAVSGTPAIRSEVRVRGQVDASDLHLVHATDLRVHDED
ncbi:DUF5666 domain-containing protein [Deinococcus sonorensis]|uniref:DUF5666 domain-containing protein n=2 Tax=Deinococcus sonorensis TaxID=309891 RepID=A0AAU7U6L9_9DEIO